MSNVTFSYDDDGNVVVEIPERKESVKIAETDTWEPVPDGYTLSELKKLWLQFAGDTDEVEKLSGFAQCSPAQAKRLIHDFKSTSRTKRLAEADEERRKATTTTAPEKPTQAKRKGRQKKIVEAEIDDSQLEHIAPDALLAALVNNKYEFSEILAEGRNSKRSVVVERFSGVYRLKRTSYQFFGDFDSALQAARKEGLKLKTFGR